MLFDLSSCIFTQGHAFGFPNCPKIRAVGGRLHAGWDGGCYWFRIVFVDCLFLFMLLNGALSLFQMCGPTGVGFLYGKSDLLQDLPPFLGKRSTP